MNWIDPEIDGIFNRATARFGALLLAQMALFVGAASMMIALLK